MDISCTITKRKLKRKAMGSGVFRNGTWEPCFPGAKAYRFSGDEILREPGFLYSIILVQTDRSHGNVKKRRFPITKLEYWEIVDDFLERTKRKWYWKKDILGIHEGRIVDGLREQFPNLDRNRFESYLKVIMDKFAGVRDHVIADYKKSEEYSFRIAGMKNEHSREERPGKENRKPDEGSRVRRERCERVLKDLVSFKTISNKEMAAEIVNAGYRKMAVKYHPDNGGDIDDMRQLNEVKAEMLRLLSEN